MSPSDDEVPDDDRAALEAHYLAHPEARPTLGEVAIAYAEQEGLPVAQHPDLITEAALELSRTDPSADPLDVLILAQQLDADHRRPAPESG